MKHLIKILANVVLLGILLPASPADATHSWGNYHWARTTASFNLNLGDNLTPAWDPYLVEASSDWDPSTVLDTTIVAGTVKGKNCQPTSGRVEVCNGKYGNNGWIGLAQIWISGNHITQGVVKLNDTYFSRPAYNSPAWKRMVMCQEIAHTFGLDHQDEGQTNTNLGSCMDYTNNPLGPPSNEHPNQHDFDQLELIYDHVETTTVSSGNTGQGNKVITFIIEAK